MFYFLIHSHCSPHTLFFNIINSHKYLENARKNHELSNMFVNNSPSAYHSFNGMASSAFVLVTVFRNEGYRRHRQITVTQGAFQQINNSLRWFKRIHINLQQKKFRMNNFF